MSGSDSGSGSGSGDDTGRSGRVTPFMSGNMINDKPQTSIYESSRAEALSTPLLWKYARGEEGLEYSEDNDKLWEILNELAENERILDNKIALLHEEQRRMFAEARNSNTSTNVNTFANVVADPGRLDELKKLMHNGTRGGKSRRVFRKKTKTTRRRNKKSNRSHRRHRRTSHVAKQT